MIEFKDIKANAEKAYNNDELYEFIMGRNGYQLRVIDAPVDVPTDWTRIIPNGIYAVYQELEDGNVVYKYEQAIIKAINGTCQELWCAINILYFQIDHEKMNKSPFFIDKTILNGLTDIILNKRQDLEKEFPYGKNGWNMYEDILRLNHNFKTDWNESFLY